MTEPTPLDPSRHASPPTRRCGPTWTTLGATTATTTGRFEGKALNKTMKGYLYMAAGGNFDGTFPTPEQREADTQAWYADHPEHTRPARRDDD